MDCQVGFGAYQTVLGKEIVPPWRGMQPEKVILSSTETSKKKGSI
jgi:hypothetical protein